MNSEGDSPLSELGSSCTGTMPTQGGGDETQNCCEVVGDGGSMCEEDESRQKGFVFGKYYTFSY